MLSAKRAVAALLENAALEGRVGTSVKDLFETYLVGAEGDVVFRDACWRLFLRAHESSRSDEESPIRLFVSSSPSDTITGDLSFDEAVASDVWVIACEALRFRALHLTAQLVMDEGSTGFLILETVGKSRAKGLSTMDISSRIRENLLPREVESKKFDAELRTVHHYMDRLISQKLLVKKMVQITENFKCKRFNIVLLPRFDSSFDLETSLPQSVFEDGPAWKVHAVDYLVSYLKQQENGQCTFNDGMRAVSIEKRRLEAMKNHIIVESKKPGSSFPMEIFTANRADTKQRFWCLRLRNVGGISTSEEPQPSRIVHEMGLVQQVYDAVVAAGPLGITSPDLKHKFGMYGKWTYRLLTLLTTSYHVRMEKTVIGRNSVYRLIAASPPCPQMAPPLAAAAAAVIEPPEHHADPRKRALSESTTPPPPPPPNKKKRVHPHTLRYSKVAADADPIVPVPALPSVTDTTALRRQHILERLCIEKVVSLYSLRSSIIELENYAHDGKGLLSFNSGHRVDVRSIIRIVESSPDSMTLLQCDMPIKSSLTASGTKLSRVVLAKDATDADLKRFLNAYARDSRIQTLNSKAFTNPNVTIQPNDPPSSTSIAYKLKDVLTAKNQADRDRESQSHVLGKCHGFLYRCRLFHTHVFGYLQTAEDNPLLADVAAAHMPDRLFLLDPIFQSMSVAVYVRILGIGQLFAPDELVQLQAAIKANTIVADLPPTLKDKTTRHQSRRLTKLLRALIDLKVIKPHRLGHDTLMAILQGTDANGDLDLHRLVQYTLYDRVIGGFFIWHRHARIYFNVQHDDVVGWNSWSSVRVNSTKFPYSFGHNVPLVHSFETHTDVDVFWEALECCATEQLSFNPSPGRVMKLPPLISTDHINMVAAKNWTPNTHGVRYSRRDKKAPLPRIPGSSKVVVVRRTRKKQTTNQQPVGGGGGPVRRKKYKFVPRGVRLDLTFTDEEDTAIFNLYLAQLQAIWKVSVPVEMQVPDEPVAIRGPHVTRAQVSTVVITRTATPHRSVNRVRRRIDELLAKVPNKLRLLALKASFFGSITFDEEAQIHASPRLGALVTRVFMILFTSDGSYNQMAAEHLVGAWSRYEITLVWRYFWLKGWIVVAKPFHGRGFVLTRRFHEIFKATCTASYPLALFVEAAEQTSFLAAADESIQCCGAVEHAALVLGHGHYQVRHTPLPEVPQKPPSMKRRRDHRLTSSGCGLLNHLDQSERDQWHATFILSADAPPPRVPDCVFSHQMWPSPEQPPSKRFKTAQKKQRPRLVPFVQFERALLPVQEAGLSVEALVAALGTTRTAVEASVLVYVDEDKLVEVHGWTSLLYVLPQFSQIWTVYPYTTTTRGTIQLDTSLATSAHPWLKLTAQPNGPWLVRFQRKMVALLIKFPGCTEAAVLAGVEGVLPLQQVRLLLADLVQEEVLYARIVLLKAEKVDLFAIHRPAAPQIYVPSDDLSLLHVDRQRYAVHYFPTPDCIVKYGQLAQEIDRV
ncbi:hypothetical protein DYB30_008058 [Aphanomyces astaci]|uniref:B-block binding subunit of TFIIIC domain-containing protein n=1 Tax=Aphanomyces astaci TaxID=112090 RepID=A0A397CP96_APHAT|nr:hypothetical protein DYB30_008058 [Aphanomyces astaci]